MPELNRRQFFRSLTLGAAATSAAVLTACAAADPVTPVPSDEGVAAAVRVRVIDNRFEPASVTVRPGDAVEWVFEGSMKHDVIAESGEFASELLPRGSSYTHVFNDAGEHSYYCSVHPEMTGTVTVK